MYTVIYNVVSGDLQILKSVDSSKMQESKFLENEALFSYQINKIINYTIGVRKNERIVFLLSAQLLTCHIKQQFAKVCKIRGVDL